jgi:Family of unknown function (DUF6064)
MSEWWTYGLSDFLLFSPRTYYRLIERYNLAFWPAHVLTIGLGLGILGMLRRPTPARSRAIAAVLAALWAWVGWAFVWRRYAAINWAATYFMWLFAIEAVLLGIGAARGWLRLRPARDAAGKIGIALLVTSVTVYPVFAVLAGRGWAQAEVFGLAPDPTVVATLGLLLLATGRARSALLVAPLLLCCISAATLWAMGSPEAWLLVAALAVAGVALRRGSSSRVAPGIAGESGAAERETNP